MKKIGVLGLLAAAPLLLLPPESKATELVYTPVNPSFGGSPLNGSFLLQQAESQNKFKDKASSFKNDPFDDFAESLQRRVLSAVANKIVGDFDDKPLTDGELQVGDFLITVHSGGDGTNVVISDPTTGRETTVTIPNFIP